MRRRRRRGHRRGATGRGDDDRRRRHRRPQARLGEGASAPPTRATPRPTIRSSTSGRSPEDSAPTCASRRSATPPCTSQAFEARDLAGTVVLVGVPQPEMTLELPFIEVFGRGGALKSSWYGDCLPSRDFPMLDRPLPAGSPRPRPLRLRDDRARRRRGGVPQDGARRGAALASWCSDHDDRTGHHRRNLRARRRRVGRHEQHLAGRRRPRGRGVRRRPRPPADRRGGQRAASAGDRAHPRPQRPHQRRGAAARRRRRADPAARRRPHAVGRRVARRGARRVVEPGTTIIGRRPRARRAAHAGPLPRVLLLPRRRVAGVVFSGDTLFCGGPGRHRAQLQRRADDPAVDPRRPARRCPTRRSCTPGTASRRRSAPSATVCSPEQPNSASDGFMPSRQLADATDHGVVQHYPWGDRTSSPTCWAADPTAPWAELWLGTHPHGPSTHGRRHGRSAT